MCGICGFNHPDANLVRKMTELLKHRGPDSSGFFISDGISMGVRRLSAIDLVSGDQPIFNEEGTLCVVFNGEVFNYRELRAVLEKNHIFTTNSDTEIVVHAYEEWGIDFLSRLRGEFAFAIGIQRT